MWLDGEKSVLVFLCHGNAYHLFDRSYKFTLIFKINISPNEQDFINDFFPHYTMKASQSVFKRVLTFKEKTTSERVGKEAIYLVSLKCTNYNYECVYTYIYTFTSPYVCAYGPSIQNTLFYLFTCSCPLFLELIV